MLRNLLHPHRHKLAIAASLAIVAALTGLGLLANSISERQTRVEHTVKLQTVKVQQLLCEHPKTKSCERHAYNLIASCVAVKPCHQLLVLASTTPTDIPIAAPAAKQVFEPEPEGGGPQPSPGHQQAGGHEPPPGHHSHPGKQHPTPSPEPAPAPAPAAPAPTAPPASAPPGHEEGSPALKVCADLPLIKKCVEADVAVE